MTRFEALMKKAQAYKKSGIVYSVNGEASKWYRPDVEALIEYYLNL